MASTCIISILNSNECNVHNNIINSIIAFLCDDLGLGLSQFLQSSNLLSIVILRTYIFRASAGGVDSYILTRDTPLLKMMNSMSMRFFKTGNIFALFRWGSRICTIGNYSFERLTFSVLIFSCESMYLDTPSHEKLPI